MNYEKLVLLSLLSTLTGPALRASWAVRSEWGRTNMIDLSDTEPPGSRSRHPQIHALSRLGKEV